MLAQQRALVAETQVRSAALPARPVAANAGRRAVVRVSARPQQQPGQQPRGAGR